MSRTYRKRINNIEYNLNKIHMQKCIIVIQIASFIELFFSFNPLEMLNIFVRLTYSQPILDVTKKIGPSFRPMLKRAMQYATGPKVPIYGPNGVKVVHFSSLLSNLPTRC